MLTVFLAIGATEFLDTALGRVGRDTPLGFLLGLGTFAVGISAGTVVLGGYLALLTKLI